MYYSSSLTETPQSIRERQADSRGRGYSIYDGVNEFGMAPKRGRKKLMDGKLRFAFRSREKNERSSKHVMMEPSSCQSHHLSPDIDIKLARQL